MDVIGKDEQNEIAVLNREEKEGGEDGINKDDEFIVIFGKNLNITRKQLTAITLLSVNFFLSATFYSLFAPFLPSEALKKNINQTQVGIIFGIFELVSLIFSPLFGKYLLKLGVRFLFISGLFLSGGSEILYGFLEMCPDGNVYFFISLLCRMVTALGCSMSLSYAIVGFYFPTKASSLVAMLEVFNGLGFMLGPVIGGFLFQIGGFQLPFFVAGSLTFFMFIVAFFIFPDIDNNINESSTRDKSLPFLPLFKLPEFVLTILVSLMTSILLGFIQPSIELHLSPLKLKPVQIGLILLCPTFFYIIVSPVAGYLADKHPNVIPWCMFFSGILSFLGPIPLYNLKLNLWLFLSGFILFGIGIGAVVIPTYSELTKIAIKHGYPNDLRLQGLISGIFTSIWSTGALIGPILGGYVCEKIGFEKSSFYLVIVLLIFILFYGLYNVFKLCCKNNTNNHIIFKLKEEDVDGEPTENSPLIVNA